VSNTRWKKSLTSAEQTDCVELAHTLDAVRDSKDGGVLRVPVTRLVVAVRLGRLGLGVETGRIG
jgi:hypothetical protein